MWVRDQNLGARRLRVKGGHLSSELEFVACLAVKPITERSSRRRKDRKVELGHTIVQLRPESEVASIECQCRIPGSDQEHLITRIY